MSKIKIDKELYKKVKHVSETAGYSSVDEFISHLLEKVVDQSGPEENDEDVLKRLQGLGYIS
jgi:metal-responsive CopG/Arc/MetJ family transcriptional regulator